MSRTHSVAASAVDVQELGSCPHGPPLKVGMGLSTHEVTPTLVGHGRAAVCQGRGLRTPTWLEA